AGTDIQLWRYGLAGLADLVLVGVPAGIGRGAGSSDRSAERIGDLFDHGESLSITQPTAAGNNDRRLSHLRTSAGLHLDRFNDFRPGRMLVKGHVQRLHRRRPAGLLGCVGVGLDTYE